MLPVTHGAQYTRLQIVLYTLVLVAVSLLPFAIRMSGVLYLVAALVLGRRRSSATRCASTSATATISRARRSATRSSISPALFSALLVDHYWQ